MEVSIRKEEIVYFWKKKEFVSFILCVLVFFIHISSFVPYLDGDSGIAIINRKLSFFFNESITRFAVPMYFILSGIAFFRDYDNKKYIPKIKSRFFSLCIPYIVWNTIWMFFEIVCSYTIISSFFVGRKKYILSFVGILKSIFLAESNGPFWFVLYLIVFMIISPLLNLIIYNKYIGIISIFFLSILEIINIPIVETLKIDAILFYLLGALLGKHYFTFVIKKTCKISQAASIIFLLLYIFLKNIFPTNHYLLLPFIKIIVFIIASYALWSTVDLFMERLSIRPIYTRSFPIYAMHVNVSAIICKICYLLLPKSSYFAVPNFIITAILTITAINLFCIIFERYLPSIYAIFMGKRLKPKISNERKNNYV